MSLQTISEMEKHILYLGSGIQGLELRRHKEKRRNKKLKKFREYLGSFDYFTLPSSFKAQEDSINETLLDLKESMRKRKYPKSLLCAAKLSINLEKLYKEIYSEEKYQSFLANVTKPV